MTDYNYYCLKLKFKVASTNRESDLKLKHNFGICFLKRHEPLSRSPKNALHHVVQVSVHLSDACYLRISSNFPHCRESTLTLIFSPSDQLVFQLINIQLNKSRPLWSLVYCFCQVPQWPEWYLEFHMGGLRRLEGMGGSSISSFSRSSSSV